jgi:hypothetical protein
VAIFFVAALVARLLFRKKIGSKKYYVIALTIGFLLHRGLVSVLTTKMPREPSSSAKISSTSKIATDLDKPFIPPREEDMESFPAQLDAATRSLNATERNQITQAIGFITYSLMAYAAENEPKELEKMTELDHAAKSFLKLYRFAQKNGASMTLRKYIDLAEEFKRQKPEWWQQYLAQTQK